MSTGHNSYDTSTLNKQVFQKGKNIETKPLSEQAVQISFQKVIQLHVQKIIHYCNVHFA